jgi:6-phosphogluconolactonase
MTPEIDIAEPEELPSRFVARLSQAARAALAGRGRVLLALSGGSVAERFVPAWLAADVDWARVELLWVDERAVAADHPDSNFGLARRSGLDRLPLRPQAIHPMTVEGDDLDAAAAGAERELRAAIGSPPRIDLALVGIGVDGHVASLFPGRPLLSERERLVVAVDDAPKPPARRLTWTLAAFALVDLLVVAATGDAKAAAVAAAFSAEGSELPAARAARAARRTVLLVDAAAGRLLSR